MVNPINISGMLLEDRLEEFLMGKNLSYTRAKVGKFEIDFQIETQDGTVFADCTNQNVGGSVEEKLPHKLWKYAELYHYHTVFIVTGTHKISKHVTKHCNEVAEKKEFKLHLLDYDQFTNYLKDANSLNPLGE